eukprot:12999789-Alexandrium_andersonii.AAC.1
MLFAALDACFEEAWDGSNARAGTRLAVPLDPVPPEESTRGGAPNEALKAIDRIDSAVRELYEVFQALLASWGDLSSVGGPEWARARAAFAGLEAELERH